VSWKRPARTVVERRGNRRALDIRRQLAEEIRRAREDAGLSQRQLAGLAGISSSTLHAIELDRHDPCLDTLCRVAAALGMDLGVRLFAGTGPLIRDHSQTAMIAALLQEAHGGWIPDPEVWVHRPVRGVIDLVLRMAEPPLVACEAQSDLRRLEQQVRWFRSKAAALAEERAIDVSRLLLLRDTRRTRAIAAEFEAFLAAAYPAPYADLLASIRDGHPWPGDGIVWCRVEGGAAVLMDRPPRGVRLGRSGARPARRPAPRPPQA
jgi:transcriptional regulator with XRE-family HTH domain